MEPDIRACEGCDKATVCNFVINRGQHPVDLLVLTDFQERPNSEYRQIIETMAESAGLDLDKVYITGAVKHRIKDDAGVREIKACKEVVDKEIELYKPKVIVPMGNQSLKSSVDKTGITKARGRVMEWGDKFIVPTFSVASILHNPENQTIIESDFKRAWKVVEGFRPTLPNVSYATVTNIDDARGLFQILNQQELVTFDIETNDTYDDDDDLGPYPYKDDRRILAISFSFQEGTGFCIPLWIIHNPLSFEDIEEVEQLLREFLENENVKKVAHNGKFDCQYIKVITGITVKNYYADTMLAHHVINEERGTHGLKQLAWTYTDMGGYDDILDHELSLLRGAEKNLENVPFDTMTFYACADADVTLRLWHIFEKQMEEIGVTNLFFNVVMKTHDSLLEMELNGVKFDTMHHKQLQLRIEKELDDLYEKLRSYPEVLLVEDYLTKKNNEGRKTPAPPVKFNFNSNPQVQFLLFDVMEMPKVKETDAGNNSADNEVLEVLKAHHPMIEDLVKHRKLAKFYGTYVKPVPTWIGNDGLVHTSYLIHGTVTGRLSSQRPNLQNLPARDKDLGKAIKQMVIPRNPDNLILQADYSQMEMRVLAMFSKDPVLIEAFYSGQDLHKFAAHKVGGYSFDDITPEIRQIYKTIQFGIVYCKGVPSLCEELQWFKKDNKGNVLYNDEGKPILDLKRGKRVLAEYFNTFKRVDKWRDEIKAFAHENKFVRSLFGRYRHLPAIDAIQGFAQAEAERQAVNAPIQSTASDITMESLYLIRQEIHRRKMKTLPIITVHDSMVFEVPPAEVEETSHIVKTISNERRHNWMNVPIKVDISLGLDYGHLEEIAV